MCAIVGSGDEARLRELWKLNSHRGSHSHSFAQFDPKTGMISLEQSLGEMKPEKIIVPDGRYGVGHCQAPTSEAGRNAIHPARVGDDLLWHNGIVKGTHVKRLQETLNSQESWDTALILETLVQGKELSDIDGSFACLWYHDGNLSVFRNELCPLYLNPKTFDLSSMPFATGELLSPHVIWTLNFEERRLTPSATFSTKENPYLI